MIERSGIVLKVYSSPFCGRCKAIKLRLSSLGIPYQEVLFDSLSESDKDSLITQASKLGLNSLPILELDGEVTSLEEASKRGEKHENNI